VRLGRRGIEKKPFKKGRHDPGSAAQKRGIRPRPGERALAPGAQKKSLELYRRKKRNGRVAHIKKSSCYW